MNTILVMVVGNLQLSLFVCLLVIVLQVTLALCCCPHPSVMPYDNKTFGINGYQFQRLPTIPTSQQQPMATILYWTMCYCVKVIFVHFIRREPKQKIRVTVNGPTRWFHTNGE